MGRCLRPGALIDFTALVLIHSNYLCHKNIIFVATGNPNCSKRFSKTNIAESRPLPANLVDAVAITAFYDAHPEAAVHRSPDRVCRDCGHGKNVKIPRWQSEYMYASLFRYVLVCPIDPAATFVACAAWVRHLDLATTRRLSRFTVTVLPGRRIHI
jgi:hypothetical protein